MKKIPWKQIVFYSLGVVVLIVARSAVTVGKSIYFGYDWYVDLVKDPWLYVGMVVAAVGLVSLIALALQRKDKNSRIEE